jgi:hypothetical protein
MNTIMASLAKTSVTDVLALFAFSLLAAGILHVIRGRKVKLGEDIVIVLKRYGVVRSTHTDHSVDHMLKVRKYHWSLAAFILSWLPFLMLVTGNTCCSVLHDAGYPIFPWPLLAVGLLFGLALWVAQSMRLRSIKRLLFPTPVKSLEATAAAAAS